MSIIRRILIIHSSGKLDTQELGQELGQNDYLLFEVESADAARKWVSDQGLPHLVLIEIGDSLRDNLSFCREVHQSSGMPIVAIAEDSISQQDVVEGLRYADDLVRRQFCTGHELEMRIRRVLSRVENFGYASGPVLKVSDSLLFDEVGHQVFVRGETRKLTPTESALLTILIANRGRVIDAETLLESGWTVEFAPKDRNALRVHLHRLRKKIEIDLDNPVMILTERGTGYRFAAE